MIRGQRRPGGRLRVRLERKGSKLKTTMAAETSRAASSGTRVAIARLRRGG
jgi:hypothetical protein